MHTDKEKNDSSSCCLERVIATFTNGIDTVEDLCARTLESWEDISLAIVDKIERLLDSRPPAKVLDLACGRGDVAIALAQRGYDVTAMDCTPAMLSVALEICRAKPNHVKWIYADMRTMDFKAEMEYVLLRDVIFSTFESADEDRELLRRIAHALKPGGRCLFEVYNKEFAVQHKVENILRYDVKKGVFVGNGETGMSPLRLYSKEEWHSMLTNQGLKIVTRDGWRWKNDPCPPPWRADFIVAEKKG